MNGSDITTNVRFTRRALVIGTGAAVVLSTPFASRASRVAPVVYPGVADLTSNASRMLSYRHQEHLWQTADGALHLLVNRGTHMPGPGLSLFSSANGGLNWTFQCAFEGTDAESTGDGQLQHNLLSVMYPTADGNLMFAELQYDPFLQRWARVSEATAHASTQFGAINPAFAVDGIGSVWCCFVAQDRANGNNSLRMVYRPGGSTEWSDTGLTFGPVDSRSIQRSARPVRAAGGMGMVFAVRESVYWAFRYDGLPPNSTWSISTLYVSPNPKKPITNPYSSHFSVVGDDQGSVHLLYSDDFDALYFQRSAQSVWTAPKALNTSGKSSYCQMAIVNGMVCGAYSMQRGNGQYMLSSNGGDEFTQAAALFQPRNSGTAKYGTPRLELPTRASGALTVLQQFSDGPVQLVLVYTIPSPT